MNEIKNLMFDLASCRTIYDAEQGREISKSEANDTLRAATFELLGITKDSTPRQMRRALNSENGKKFFQVIEEILDEKIATGWHESEFFNEYVEDKNLKDGDANEFWTDKDVILTVAKVSGDHHDLTMQKLAEGSPIAVPTSVYAVKVGSDLRLFLTGRKDWSAFIDAVAKAFVKQVQDEIYAEFMNAGTKIPAKAQFNITGDLVTGTKNDFDTLIEDVSTANDGAPVIIMGTKTALKRLNGLSDVNWRSDSQRESVAHSGMLGDYEGTILMEIPQRFANNTTATKLVDSTKLMIMPVVDMKPVKFVDYGETELTVDEAGKTMDDMQSYEVQRRMGISTVITKYFGVWTLSNSATATPTP